LTLLWQFLASFPGAIAKIIARNCQRRADFQKRVEMWVHEEEVEGRKLTEIINSDHENVKYLPGVALPPNLLLDEFDS